MGLDNGFVDRTGPVPAGPSLPDAPTHGPTIRDVAQRAGVSRAAVSKVIRNAYGVSPDMRDRVNKAIAELDYRPRTAARVMRGSSYTIGLETPQLENEHHTQIARGVLSGLAGTGYDLVIQPSEDISLSMQTVERLVDRQLAGLVAITPFVPSDWLERLGQRVPIVQVGRPHQSVHYDTITCNDEIGVRLVMDHLFSLGHTRIVHLSGVATDSLDAFGPQQLRLGHYQEAMLARGLRPEVVHCNGREAGARRAVLDIMARADAPTAVFAVHDTVALGALRAAAELGLDPGRLSIVGYDDVTIASHPLVSLTTVDQFGVEQGKAAARFLLERVRGRTEAVHLQFAPELRTRGSSARPS